jgi:serine/threonine protein kinase
MLPVGTIFDGRYAIVEPLAEGGMGGCSAPGGGCSATRWPSRSCDPISGRTWNRANGFCARPARARSSAIRTSSRSSTTTSTRRDAPSSSWSLRQEIIDRGPLPLDEVQSIMGPLYGALQLAHDQGILHRDLKPANIVAHDSGGGTRAHKIVDFGLVRIQASDSTGLTGAHQIGVSSRGAADAAALRGRGDSEGARARARGSLPVREGRRRRPPYRLCVRNASMSASSSITFATGFPVP